METILLHGDSKENSRLLIQLAKQLNFKARKLSANEIEEMGIILSINEGLQSGLLDAKQKNDFIESLKES